MCLGGDQWSAAPASAIGAGPSPNNPGDNGAVTIAQAGLLTYLKGSIVGQVLTWGAAFAPAFISNVSVAANAAIDVSKLGQSGASTAQFLQWDGLEWTPGDPFYSLVTDSDNTDLPQEERLRFGNEFTLLDEPGFSTLVHAPGIATAQATATAAQQPFKATYYVDPAFAGTQLGSASNPFTTIAAAFAAAAALVLTGGIIFIPPGTTVAENVVFPTTGKWELSAPSSSPTFIQSSVLNGTVTCNATGAVRHTISNIEVLGAVSGDATNQTCRLWFRNCAPVAALALTASTGGNWTLLFTGEDRVYTAQSTVAVAGAIDAINVGFGGNITLTFAAASAITQFTDCQLIATGLTAAGGITLRFFGSNFAANTVITASSGTVVVEADGASFARMVGSGTSFAGAGAVTLKTLNSNASDTRVIANILGSTNLGARAPAGLYQLSFDMTQLVAGTSGTAQLNAIYTDLTGTLVTVAVGGAGGQLLVNAAAGTKASGTLQFQHNGAASPIAFSVTPAVAIVTGGTWSCGLAVTVQRLN